LTVSPEESVAAASSADEAAPAFSRILLKLSGEALLGPREYGVDLPTVERIAAEVAQVHARGVETAVVVGAGNIYRGMAAAAEGMDRATADYVGMLSTLHNALALQDRLERLGVPTRVLSALTVSEVAEPYIRRRAIRHLEKGRVVIFAAGTGNPFFTTDTAAALRAAEIDAEALLKGTHSGVDGVYDADPRTDTSATKFDEIGYMEVMNKDLRVMDATAIAFCRDNQIPIVVFDMSQPGSLRAILEGGKVGTLIT
jgi:uridylate kinase